MPPLVSNQVHGRLSVRVRLLQAKEELEQQISPGCAVFLWAHKDQPSPTTTSRRSTDSFDIANPTGVFSRVWRYDYLVFEPDDAQPKVVDWKGRRSNDWIAYSDGAYWQGNDLYLPPHPDQLTKNGARQPSGEHWMSTLRTVLPASTRLSALTIPGTHNSHALPGLVDLTTVPFFRSSASRLSECQSASLARQLRMGIRFFDFRTDGAALNLRHGRVALLGNLRPCLEAIHAFLTQHPDETVLVSVKRDMETFVAGTRAPETPETRRAIEDCLDAYAPRVYADAAVPTLAQCRGKIVLLWGEHAAKGVRVDGRRPGAPGVGYDSDDFEAHAREVVERARWNAGQRPWDDGNWYELWTNASSPAGFVTNSFKSPKDHADYSNHRLSSELAGVYSDRCVRLGVVAVDFAYPYLVKQTYLTNF